MRRAGAVALALWLSVSIAERIVPDHCAQHDPVGAAIDAMAHGMAGAAMDAPHHGTGAPGAAHHHCTCLEECCAAAPALLARAGAAAFIPAAARTLAPAAGALRIPDARPDTRLPFANGPPHALAA